MIRRVAAPFLLLIPLLGLAPWGCRRDRDPNLIRVATDATFPPFHFIAENGDIRGYDIDLATAVAREAGYEAKVRVVPYSKLLQGLLKGHHDLVAATTGITKERSKVHSFSVPYFETCQAAVVRRDAGEPATVAELSGKKVGASGDGTSANALRGLSGVTAIHLEEGVEGPKALLAGEIDALIVDEFEAVALARDDSGLFVLREPIALEQYAFVLRSNDRELKDRIDQAVGKLRGNGTIAKLREQYGLERGPDWPVQLP